MSYKGQHNLAKDLNCAITNIEDFFNDDLDEYLVCNDNIKQWVKLLLEEKYNKPVSVWTTNCGYNKRVYLYPTKLDDPKVVAEEIAENNRVKHVIKFNEQVNEKREFSRWLNEPKTGRYNITIRYSYEDENGEKHGGNYKDTIFALSGYNAYVKGIDLAARFCANRGGKFIRAKSVISPRVKIDYVGDFNE